MIDILTKIALLLFAAFTVVVMVYILVDMHRYSKRQEKDATEMKEAYLDSLRNKKEEDDGK